MRGQAMKLIVKQLESLGYDLTNYRALEFFAREGDWQTQIFYKKVAWLDAWEIDQSYEEKLRKNLPAASVKIGNSFILSKELEFQNVFDLIVLDNPQNIYGEYCEHFEALNLIPNLMKSQAILIFNVNRKPFNIDQSPKWKEKRLSFYGRDSSNLTINFLIEFYSKFFKNLNLTVNFSFDMQRNEDYLSYLIFGLAK